MAAHYVRIGDSPLAQASQLTDGLTKMLPLLGELSDVLPQDTLLWKLRLLQTGCKALDDVYRQVRAHRRCPCEHGVLERRRRVWPRPNFVLSLPPMQQASTPTATSIGCGCR